MNQIEIQLQAIQPGTISSHNGTVSEYSTPAQMTERMRQERAKANSQAYIAALLQQNPVSINEVTLAKALAK